MEKSPSKWSIVFRLYLFLRFCSLYDQNFSPAGLERRHRLAESFDTLVSTLRPDFSRKVTWLITEDYNDKILQKDTRLNNLPDTILDADVERYTHVVQNQSTNNFLFSVLESSIFKPLYLPTINYDHEIITAVDFTLALIEAVTALPYLSETNRIIFITTFAPSILALKKTSGQVPCHYPTHGPTLCRDVFTDHVCRET
jgi:hypothetical protein